MGKYDCLFEPLQVGSLQLKNRIVLEPMGIHSHRLVNADGSFTEDGIAYYETIAKGGTGLIITSAMPVNSAFDLSKGSKAAMDLAGEEFIKNTKKLTERLHRYGAKIFMQLSAGAGRVQPRFIADGEPVAPSDGLPNFWNPSITHRALTREEIERYIRCFGEAARKAKEGGVDGVEIHAVHEGYLLDQFTLAFCNKRTDEYGGSLEGRFLFAKKIVEAIKESCGKDYPVSIRYSVRSMMKGFNSGALPGEVFTEVGRDLNEGIAAAKLLEACGYDMLNADNGTYDSWWYAHPPVYMPEGCNLAESVEIKKHVHIPVVCAGRMENPELALKAIQEKQIDGIGLARQLLADPEWPNKLMKEQEEEIRPCIACHAGCLNRIFKGQDLCCALNPAVAREKEYAITPAETKKHIVVVGGGIGGMEAARVCALRGHQVDLYEKSGKLGGMFIPASAMSFKESDKRLIAWYGHQMEKLGVNLHMNTAVDSKMLKELNADEVFVATGSSARTLQLPGFESDRVLTAVDALMNPEKVQGDLVIIGGGLTGIEIAYEYARKGSRVTVLEAMDKYLNVDLAAANRNFLLAAVDLYHIDVQVNAKVSAYTDGSVTYTNPDGEHSVKADTVIVSIGYNSENSLAKELGGEHVHVIGDADHVSNLMGAIWQAYEAAVKL